MITAAFVLALAASSASEAPAAAPPPASRQYTFAWRFVDGDSMAPRGGTTRGPELTLSKVEHPGWKALQEEGIEAFERDRRAILAMQGEYRVSFDFIEVAGFLPGWKPSRPYQSWATEKVYVLEDNGRFISLQHILVMQIRGEDGKLSEPFVTKHWRQDWQYEPEQVLTYLGHHRWTLRPVTAEERAGAWSQSVYQVDDSPRYGDVARWQHEGNYSSWASADGWRPLPRREFSVRDDYHVLVGSNRHTIGPTGWVHEQQNNKVVLDADGQPRTELPVLAREFGYNRYERIEGYDFAAGDRYLERTAAMWAAVRDEWSRLLAAPEPVRLRGAPDRDQLFGPLFRLAGEIDSADQAPNDPGERARELVRAYLAGPDEAAESPVRY